MDITNSNIYIEVDWEYQQTQHKVFSLLVKRFSYIYIISSFFVSHNGYIISKTCFFKVTTFVADKKKFYSRNFGNH